MTKKMVSIVSVEFIDNEASVKLSNGCFLCFLTKVEASLSDTIATIITDTYHEEQPL